MKSLINLVLDADQELKIVRKVEFLEKDFSASGEAEILLVDSEQTVDISVSFNANRMLRCHRCLKEFSSPLELTHHLVVAKTDEGWEVDDETESMRIVDLQTGRFDVYELLRQLLIESLEMRILCSEDCKGLCAKCGQDLNVKQCSCSDEDTDPRWDMLKELISRKEV